LSCRLAAGACECTLVSVVSCRVVPYNVKRPLPTRRKLVWHDAKRGSFISAHLGCISHAPEGSAGLRYQIRCFQATFRILLRHVFLRSWATQVCAYETNLCETGHEGPEGALSLTSALDEGCESTPRPGRFTPRNDPVLIVQEAGWAPGPVWTDTKNLVPPPPPRNSIGQLLYRQRYPGPLTYVKCHSRNTKRSLRNWKFEVGLDIKAESTINAVLL
jgi:hypothetical protein